MLVVGVMRLDLVTVHGGLRKDNGVGRLRVGQPLLMGAALSRGGFVMVVMAMVTVAFPVTMMTAVGLAVVAGAVVVALADAMMPRALTVMVVSVCSNQD